ncbi:MAG: hypothetical protein KAZ88_07315 [Acidimicrobiia bacterium]|nr:hypothetical protein [Acidimicrobiia bacterium]MBP8180785.1 hypothetical protein [Acidimicrobiia bacterium]
MRPLRYLPTRRSATFHLSWVCIFIGLVVAASACKKVGAGGEPPRAAPRPMLADRPGTVETDDVGGVTVVRMGSIPVVERLLGGKAEALDADIYVQQVAEGARGECRSGQGVNDAPVLPTVTHPENISLTEVYPDGFGWAAATLDSREPKVGGDDRSGDAPGHACDAAANAARSAAIDEQARASLEAVRVGWQVGVTSREQALPSLRGALVGYNECMAAKGFPVLDRGQASEWAARLANGWDGTANQLAEIADLDAQVGAADADCWTPVAAVYIAEQDFLFGPLERDYPEALGKMDELRERYAAAATEVRGTSAAG